MSRSYRKNPICGTCNGSDKQDKRLANRKLRRIQNICLTLHRELPTLRQVSNVWDMQKDGKQQFDPIRYPELMRK